MSTQSSSDTDAVQWTTGQVLDWMTNFTDSKDEIRVKILNIVQANDLDGHALKQLRDDPDELHDLIPVLKERLTFRAMMKSLFGPISSTRQSTTSNMRSEAQNNSTQRVSAAPNSPTQSPSTSLESPPPPPIHQPVPIIPNKSTPSNNDNQTLAVLPAFSSFVTSPILPSSSQRVPVTASPMHHDVVHHDIVENDRGSGQSDVYHGVYPTGIMSDDNRQKIITSQTPIYCGQSQSVNSVAMKPTSGSYEYPFTYREMKTAENAAESSHQSTHDQRFILPCTATPRITIGSWNVGRVAKHSKALEITQKYKKILQRVKSSSSEYDHQEHIPFPAPLPTFSPVLKHQIEIGNILSFKTRFVYECAQFYMSIDPTPTHAAYRNISMTIVRTFPELADQNNTREPWRPFNTSLSQAIRNIRRRLRSVPGTGFPPVEPRYQHVNGRRITPNPTNVNHHKQSAEQARSMNTNDVSVVSTNETSEPILIEADDDPLESVEMPDHTAIDDTTIDDTDYTEKKEIVIKMEDVTSNEEDGIPEEWNNE